MHAKQKNIGASEAVALNSKFTCTVLNGVEPIFTKAWQEEKKKMFAQLMPVNANHVPAMVITSKTPLYHPLVRQLEHPILARLVQTWQDDEALYFGSELCAGGSLQVHS